MFLWFRPADFIGSPLPPVASSSCLRPKQYEHGNRGNGCATGNRAAVRPVTGPWRGGRRRATRRTDGRDETGTFSRRRTDVGHARARRRIVFGKSRSRHWTADGAARRHTCCACPRRAERSAHAAAPRPVTAAAVFFPPFPHAHVCPSFSALLLIFHAHSAVFDEKHLSRPPRPECGPRVPHTFIPIGRNRYPSKLTNEKIGR